VGGSAHFAGGHFAGGRIGVAPFGGRGLGRVYLGPGRAWTRPYWGHGCWRWGGHGWAWISGPWWVTPDYPGWVWIAPQWTWDGQQWVWQEGYWSEG
jgi:hypothetical protein